MSNIRADIDPDYVIRRYIRLHAEGRGMRSLARELGCSISPIKRILTEAGVNITRRPKRTDYMSPEEIDTTRDVHRRWQAGGSGASIARDTGMRPDEVRWRLIHAQVGRFDIPVHRRAEHEFGKPGARELWMTDDQRRDESKLRERRRRAQRGGDAAAIRAAEARLQGI